MQGGKGSTDLQGWSWEEIRRQQYDNGSQVRGLWPAKRGPRGRAVRLEFWSVWPGKEMIEEGAVSTPSLPLSKPPCAFSLTPPFQHPFPTSCTFSAHILSQRPKILPWNFPPPNPLTPNVYLTPSHTTFFPLRPSLSALCPDTPLLQNAFSLTPARPHPHPLTPLVSDTDAPSGSPTIDLPDILSALPVPPAPQSLTSSFSDPQNPLSA